MLTLCSVHIFYSCCPPMVRYYICAQCNHTCNYYPHCILTYICSIEVQVCWLKPLQMPLCTFISGTEVIGQYHVHSNFNGLALWTRILAICYITYHAWKLNMLRLYIASCACSIILTSPIVGLSIAEIDHLSEDGFLYCVG